VSYTVVDMRFTTLFFASLVLPAVFAYECRPTFSGKSGEVHFDLSPLSGERTTSKTTETPPTTNEARVRMSLCGEDTLKRDSDLSDEDQVCSFLSILRALITAFESNAVEPYHSVLTVRKYVSRYLTIRNLPQTVLE
jgi:hypothetical protein